MSSIKRKYLTASLKRLNQESEQVNRKLIYAGGSIRFQSERDLEDYIEKYFHEIFPDLILFKRQHSIQLQRCDLLCCNKFTQQPVIIELKNEEDRYIVPQLTRYRKAILLAQPVANEINYSLPIKLIAIAPKFHEDNYTDKESSKFEEDFCFWQFTLELENNCGKFKLLNNSYNIPYPIFGLPNQVTSLSLQPLILPAFTMNFLGGMPLEGRDDFRKLRSLLMAQPKIKEIVSHNYKTILYAIGEGASHKKLAEITNTPRGLYLYLWLPTHVKTNIKIPVTRFGFVLYNNQSPFAEASLVEWIVCTEDTINIKDKPDEISCSFNRQGMIKWCRPKAYLWQATLGSQNTFYLLIYFLKGIKPPIDQDTMQWWESYKTQTPEHLGWYIDLAIQTWNYRIK
ncbi:hypothetical protein Cri9333_4663 [Crinalium epipsammum PCC 9333]|uniref:Uncharacterized protein n=1 Tax=Crinalium epipsammum PCC 9333 TaxID=1173022 RepID=K9W6P6_9CYAN|nr:hypothetical protein [Crinalium epipsammum]AFZ15442.1 hypothetical protein Cri9333_4663 [Crinalium epipsammum PCC 9333]